MAEKPNAYVPKNPGDIIRSSDWNELQIKAREEIRAHKHTGNEDGTQIPRTGIEANAVDGSLIDPKADVIVNTLTTNANLTVKGELSIKNTAILSNIQDLLEKVKSLETSKVNRGAGGDSIQGTLNVKALIIDGNKPVPSNIADLVDSKVNRAGDTINGSLNLKNDLQIGGKLALGIAQAQAKLHVVNAPQDAGGNTLILGNTDSSNLRLGYNTEYSWIQSHGAKPLAINTIGNNVGIGINTPIAKLDIAQSGRTAIHPATINGLYVTGDFSAADGVEFRHSNGSQGIGFGYNTIYAAGSNPDQDLQLKAKGTGMLRILGAANVTNSLQVAGAITPSAGNTESNGIMFPKNPGGGGGDAAWIRYYARTGEACTLEIHVDNDADDHIALMPSGNVGIGLVDPKAKLVINGELIRKINMATGLGPNDETDNGQIVSRVLKFTKYYAETAIRILYCDNLRIYGNNPVAARWEIRVDGQSAPGGAIYQDKYGSSGNYHAPTTILGYAQGVSAGSHTIGIWIGPAPGIPLADAWTGWNNSRWTIEVQEVWL